MQPSTCPDGHALPLALRPQVLQASSVVKHLTKHPLYRRLRRSPAIFSHQSYVKPSNPPTRRPDSNPIALNRTSGRSRAVTKGQRARVSRPHVEQSILTPTTRLHSHVSRIVVACATSCCPTVITISADTINKADRHVARLHSAGEIDELHNPSPL